VGGARAGAGGSRLRFNCGVDVETLIPQRLRPVIVGLLALGVAYWGLRAEPRGAGGAHIGAVLVAGSLIVGAWSVYSLWRERIRPGPLRTGLLLALAAGSIALVALQPNGPGALGIFVTVIWASRAGVWGAAVALVAGAAYLAATLPRRPDPGATAVLLLGLLAAYVVPRLRAQVQAQQLQQAAVQERERLAREIHDVLAHTLSALSVQLEGARLLMRQRPDDPRALEAVERAHHLTAEGIAEVRRAVSALRGDDLPGPELLPRLAADFERESGVATRFAVEGRAVPLRADARLAIYRTAQEALTNVRKHADASAVSIRLRYADGGAELTVDDEAEAAPSAPPAGPPAGHGLTGMRERAQLLGGRLEAGPAAGGFRVRLWVPA
jgi:signal transduction histidine kinase